MGLSLRRWANRCSSKYLSSSRSSSSRPTTAAPTTLTLVWSFSRTYPARMGVSSDQTPRSCLIRSIQAVTVCSTPYEVVLLLPRQQELQKLQKLQKLETTSDVSLVVQTR